MADLTTIRNNLAAQLSANVQPEIQAYSEIPDAINVPCIIVAPARPQTKTGITLGGGTLAADGLPMSPTEFRIDLIVLCAKTSIDQQWQQTMDQWLGYQVAAGIVPIPMAIDLDPTLGGTVEWCEPLTIDPPGPIQWNGVEYFGSRCHTWISAR